MDQEYLAKINRQVKEINLLRHELWLSLADYRSQDAVEGRSPFNRVNSARQGKTDE